MLMGKQMNNIIFITGSSGFIGYHLCKRLLAENDDIKIIEIDNMNDYYDVSLKEHNLDYL